ncbi:MAG: peptidase S10 [Acidobacteriota bacterium]
MSTMSRRPRLAFLPALLLVASLASTAQAEGDAKGKKPSELEDHLVTTSHSVTIGGQRVRYEATAGTLVMRDEEGAPKATIFYIAYTRQDGRDPSKRPLTFSFNGGPGSSSVWLHLGTLGPKRVHMDPDGFPLPPPYKLVDNAESILDVTDLVFIDPVMTGYSRPAPDEDREQFHGIDEDVRSVGEFIRLYTTRNERWASPKFLVGESYGTTRAAGLAGWLQGRHGFYLNGVMLISSILDFQTARFDTGNDLPYILFLPTYTATAWYHDRLAPDLQRDLRATLDEVEEFATTEYTLALMKGDRLGDAERNAIAKKLARYTGLSEQYVKDTNLRIKIFRFTKELRRDERKTVGRLDSRFVGDDRDSAGERYEYDPSYSAIQGPYTATLNDYVRRDLGFESDLPYEILTGRVHPWSYESYQNRYVNVSETLRRSMTRNPSLKVFVANGYYDLATPYFATEYTFDHLGLPKELQGNVTMGWYEAGHMMYIHIPSLVALKRDLAAFMQSATK